MNDEYGAIAMAERVLGILTEGSFSATYKFALFIAILDLCIEKTSATGTAPTSLTTRELAQKVIELLWDQVTPYPGVGVLRFGGGRGEQAEVIRRIEHLRSRLPGNVPNSWHRARCEHPLEYERLLHFVEWKLIEMPIPRLQVLGGEEHRFLYTYGWNKDVKRAVVSAYQRRERMAFDNRLTLLPGVPENLTRLNGLLRPLFHREWAVMVARMNDLAEAQLEAFLFGSQRIPLSTVREPLVELQESRCFYCKGRLDTKSEVDHFIPWSRFPDDGLDNLVVAHGHCNNSKRDFLAAVEHLRAWTARSRCQHASLASIADALGWRRDHHRTLSVARAIYLHLPPESRFWADRGNFVPATRNELLLALG